MNNLDQFLVPGALFLVTVGFGIWVARLGKPYNQILFNFHKLIALGGVVFAVIRIIDLDPLNNFQGLLMVSFPTAALGVIGLFATGAIMSIRDEEPKIIKWAHRIFLALVVISGSLILVLIK